jgi:hypothetical protein
MYRLQLMILMSFVGGSALWAQESETESESSEPTAEESTEAESAVSDEEIDELLGLDEDYADIEDDDFDPTEDVRFEQSIPFPADI